MTALDAGAAREVTAGRPDAVRRAPARVSRQVPHSVTRGVAIWLVVLTLPGVAWAGELRLRWTGGDTDRNPGTWTIRLTEVETGQEGTYTVDGGDPVVFPVGETRVAVPSALGPHRLAVRGPGELVLTDTRTLVDDDTTPPRLTLEYAGQGTRIVPGVWTITLFDPESPQAGGAYRIDDGPWRPLSPGSTVVAVPYFAGTYTITVRATNNDRDSPGDEEVVTLTDTRQVK